MIKKAGVIILSIFVVQVITSCLPQCGDAGTYEHIYNGVTITPYDLSGFNTKPIIDSVYKNAFGLSVSVNFEFIQISMAKPKLFGAFSSAIAMSDCPEPVYKYSDPIKTVELFVTDITSGETTNVSNYFGIQSYIGDELITLEQFFIERAEWHDGFQFELVNFDSIPNSAIFTAKAYLESGIVFTEETEQINFYH